MTIAIPIQKVLPYFLIHCTCAFTGSNGVLCSMQDLWIPYFCVTTDITALQKTIDHMHSARDWNDYHSDDSTNYDR